MKKILSLFLLLAGYPGVTLAGTACLSIQNTGSGIAYGVTLYLGAAPASGAPSVDINPGDTVSYGPISFFNGYNGTYTTASQSLKWWTNAAHTGTQFTYGAQAGFWAWNTTVGCPTAAMSVRYVDGAGPPNSDLCSIQICVRNNDSRYRVYCLYRNGVAYDMQAYPGGMGVAAGGVGCYNFQDWCTNSTGWYLDLCPGEIGISNPGTNYSVVTNGPTTPPAVTNNYTPNGPAQFNPTNGWGSSNILWTSSASTNAILSQQQGNQALFDAITKGNSANDINLRSINTNITGLKGVVAGLGSNIVSGLGTNLSGGETGVVAAVSRFHLDNTNLLGQIYGAITNRGGYDTNTMDGSIDGLTNQTSIQAKTTDSYQPLSDIMDTMGSHMATPSDILQGGSASVFSFVFMGQTINLDPEVRVPGAMGFVKACITMVALIGFARFAGRLIFESVQTYAQAEGGGIPDMNIFGVNVAGVAAAIVVSIILVAAWILALIAIVDALLPRLEELSGSMELSLSNSGALYLFTNTIPTPLLVSLSVTAALLHVGAAQIIGLAATLSKFLATK